MDSVADLFRNLTVVLEEAATRQMCSGETTVEGEPADDDGLTAQRALEALNADRSTVLSLLAVMEEHPEWGIRVIHDDRPSPVQQSSSDEEVS